MQQTRKPNRRERRASKIGLNPRAQVVPITTGPLKGASVIAEPKPLEQVGAVPADDAMLEEDLIAEEEQAAPGVEPPPAFGVSDDDVVTEDTAEEHGPPQGETGYAPGTIALRAIGLMKIADEQLAADFTARSGVYQHAHFQRVAQAALIEELGYMSAQNDVVIEGLKHIVRLLSSQNDLLEHIFVASTANEMEHYADSAGATVAVSADASAVDLPPEPEPEPEPEEPVAVPVDIE